MQPIFGTDGIRGIFDREITFSLAYKIGYAVGISVKNNNPILIGRDTRSSGEILLEALSRGIQASGKLFINVGICPTPAIPFLIKKENLSSGIMISASHNPPEYNGIKIFDSNGKKIKKDLEDEIQSIISKINLNKSFQNKDLSKNTNEKLLDLYTHSLIKTMDDENLEGMRIVLDTCYGSATTCAGKIFKSLGANVNVINNEKNGDKINLNCGSTFLKPLKEAVIENNADMGFSFDGDADRVIGVDSRGNVLDGDHILFLWGRELMEQDILTNNLLISNEMANLGFEIAWHKIGGILHRTEVGDKFIYKAINEKKAILGGEQSGHILSKINNFSGDGILTAIQISKFCKKKKVSLQNWLKSSFSPFPQKLTNIKLTLDFKKDNLEFKEFCDQLADNYKKNSINKCRIYIRPSGTEPVLRVLVEAQSFEEVNDLSLKLKSKITAKIDKLTNYL